MANAHPRATPAAVPRHMEGSCAAITCTDSCRLVNPSALSTPKSRRDLAISDATTRPTTKIATIPVRERIPTARPWLMEM